MKKIKENKINNIFKKIIKIYLIIEKKAKNNITWGYYNNKKYIWIYYLLLIDKESLINIFDLN